MKKSTGIVFLVVVALAAIAYFWDWKRNPGKPVENPNDVKMAFDIKPDDQVNSINLTRDSTTMKLVLKDDGWYMTEPLSGRANQTAVADLAHDLGIVVEDRTFPATPDQMQSWGLAHPKFDLEFTTLKGGKHTLRVGAGDFSGLEVYSQVDGDTKNAILITKTVAEAADKSLEEFRDHAVLVFSYFEVTAFDLHNSSGEVAGKKQGDGWNIVKPLNAPGDTRSIAPMLQNVGAAKLTKFVDDNAKNASRATLEKYGLATPPARLSVTLNSGKSTELVLGKKDGNEYYAMDTTRGMIFRAPESLYGFLNKKATDLQAKVLFTGSEVDVARLEVRALNATTKCVKDNRGALILEQAAGQTAEAMDCPDFLAPLQQTRAKKIDNQPADSIRAKFARPAVVVTLITQTSTPAQAAPADQTKAPAQPIQQEIKIEISAPAGNSVYAKSSVSPAVYEFDKNAFDALTAKPAAPAASPTGAGAKK